jgi:P pilus assembly chaperone PapD
MSPDASQPRLSWSIARRGGATVLAATNSGDKRIQIIDLRLIVAKGRTLMVGKGLAGYVLGHSARAWTLPSKAGSVSGAVVVAASDHGPIRIPVSP